MSNLVFFSIAEVEDAEVPTKFDAKTEELCVGNPRIVDYLTCTTGKYTADSQLQFLFLSSQHFFRHLDICSFENSYVFFAKSTCIKSFFPETEMIKGERERAKESEREQQPDGKTDRSKASNV